MICSNSRGPTPGLERRQKELPYRVGSIVVVDAHECDHLTFAVYRCVDDEFPSNQLVVAVGVPAGIDEGGVVFPPLDSAACPNVEISGCRVRCTRRTCSRVQGI